MLIKSYSYAVADHFEQQKNIKAGGYTAAAAGILLFLLLIIGWKIPKIEEPIPDQGIEVNLGNSDFGSGNIEPTSQGEPAPEQVQQVAAIPLSSQPAQANKEEPDETDPEPTLVKPVERPKATIKPNNNPPVLKPIATKVPPAPVQPKPKAQMGQNTGGKGPGGNNQDAFNGVKNQGIAGGAGNQGKINGNPNSDSYTGNGSTGKGGITVIKGNRTVVRATKLEGDFTRSATLYVDVNVDENGTGSFVRVTKGINESQYTSIIKQRLASRDIQFSTGGDETTVNIMIVFKVN
ncbi:MAG: hypothetical protein ABIX01_18300 [Chitinophagaceae bacterium]